jgi:hypothetical protein
MRLYHRGKEGRNQLVICDPQQKREILRAAHVDVNGPGSGRPSTTAGGVPHNGINTTRRKISEHYWWRRLVEDVRSLLQGVHWLLSRISYSGTCAGPMFV